MRFFALLTLVFGLVIAPVQEAEAKRFGGMKSFGKRQSTYQSTPAKPSQQTTGAANSSAANGGKKGAMGGMLGGLLAGSLLGALFFGGAFEGIEFMDILMFAGIAFLLMKLFRSGAKAAAPMQRQAAADGPAINAADLSSATESATPNGADIPFNLPQGFDQAQFLDTARAHFTELQNAWNQYDMDKVREFCSPALYAQLAEQRAENAGAEHTEVEFVDAEIVRADSNQHLAEISVHYTGRTRDTADNSQDPVNETWHLERDLRQDNSPWLIVGIQQRDDT